MRIMIVDDDQISRVLLQRLLSQYGKCDEAADGVTALDLFLLAMESGEPYVLICLDIMMPLVDGVKVLTAIREIETQKGLLPDKRSKVILTTALAGSDFVKKASDIGCDGVIEKPVDIDEFFELLEKLDLITS